MPLALFDILTGRFRDGRRVGTAAPGETAALSIRDHLERLLNLREAPLSGRVRQLPDLGEIFQGLPYSLATLVAAVQETVSEGEPRLRQPTVRPISGESAGPCLALELAGRVQGHQLRFRVAFQGGMTVTVKILATRDDHA